MIIVSNLLVVTLGLMVSVSKLLLLFNTLILDVVSMEFLDVSGFTSTSRLSIILYISHKN